MCKCLYSVSSIDDDDDDDDDDNNSNDNSANVCLYNCYKKLDIFTPQHKRCNKIITYTSKMENN